MTMVSTTKDSTVTENRRLKEIIVSGVINFNSIMFLHYRRALLCPNSSPIIIRRITTTLQTLTPSPYILFLQHFSSSSKHPHSFTVNYLINNYGFSPETASKLSKRVQFENSDTPDSVLAFFTTHGFSNAQFSKIIKTTPQLLSFDPNKTILPKFNFLLSKGTSSSDLIHIVTKNPRFLIHSLDRNITSCYDFLKSFTLSDESAIQCLKKCACLLFSKNSVDNVQLLIQNGVPQSKIALMFPDLLYRLPVSPHIFEKAVNEVKELGFIPNKVAFVVALHAKLASKSRWESKIDLYKKWGWSEDIIVSAFLKYPWCMLASVDKIEAMMKFFVNQMGWESHLLAEHPVLLGLSLEKRVMPRAYVLQFLESKGLIKNAKSAVPFKVTEKMFLKKFVNFYEKEAFQLLKLYEEKRGLPSNVVKIC